MSEEVKQSKRKSTQPWKHLAQQTRRATAEARNAEYNKLTVQQKLDKLDNLGWTATRQRTKLNAQLTVAKETAKEAKKK